MATIYDITDYDEVSALDDNFQSLTTEVNAATTLLGELRSVGMNAVLQDPGLRIDGGSASAVAEAETAFRYVADGTVVLVSAGTNMPALSGTVSNGEFGIFLWTGDDSGTISQATLTTGATIGAVAFPTVPADEAIIGLLIINPTGTGDFVGGTTDLDDATVTPGAVFIDGHTVGVSFNPNASAAPTTLSTQ